MFRRYWNRVRAHLTEQYLRDLEREMQFRIDNGDLDFDDVHMLAVAQLDRITGGLTVDPAIAQALRTIAALTDTDREEA